MRRRRTPSERAWSSVRPRWRDRERRLARGRRRARRASVHRRDRLVHRPERGRARSRSPRPPSSTPWSTAATPPTSSTATTSASASTKPNWAFAGRPRGKHSPHRRGGPALRRRRPPGPHQLHQPLPEGPRRGPQDARKGRGVPFIEVYINTPIERCEVRDPKGLYKQARETVAAGRERRGSPASTTRTSRRATPSCASRRPTASPRPRPPGCSPSWAEAAPGSVRRHGRCDA